VLLVTSIVPVLTPRFHSRNNLKSIQPAKQNKKENNLSITLRKSHISEESNSYNAVHACL